MITKNNNQNNKISVITEKKLRHKTIVANKHTGILLLTQQTLQEIYQKSGELAKYNEFQVHYYALTAKYEFKDKSILYINIPTVFFNYPQEVSGASIDFEMTDVSKYSDKYKKIHELMCSKLLKSKFGQYLLNKNFTFIGTTLHSIHRHPGSSIQQSFSSTDLNTDITNPGIVFPLENGNMIPNFASIMVIKNQQCLLAHTEFRIVNTLDKTNKTAIYSKENDVSIFIQNNISTALQQIIKKENTHVIKSSNLNFNMLNIDYLKEISIIFEQSFIKPQILVFKQYLKQKMFTRNYECSYKKIYQNQVTTEAINNHKNTKIEIYDNQLANILLQCDKILKNKDTINKNELVTLLLVINNFYKQMDMLEINISYHEYMLYSKNQLLEEIEDAFLDLLIYKDELN